jgi:hypothetical protein
MAGVDVLTVGDIELADLVRLLADFGLDFSLVDAGETIPGSFWGDSEAGVVGTMIYARPDTPVHSVLHESGHVICMDPERRNQLHTDAGGDDLEEAAVCYLQVLLADDIAACGRDRLMADMDEWGYSFRLGDTRSWFENDAEDARKWLIENLLLGEDGTPSYRLRA